MKESPARVKYPDFSGFSNARYKYRSQRPNLNKQESRSTWGLSKPNINVFLRIGQNCAKLRIIL